MNGIAVPHAYPWYMRLVFALQRRRFGQALNPSLLWGRMPRVFAAFSSLYAGLDRKSSPLEPTLRSLILVRVSQINECAFCIDLNSTLGSKRGLGAAKLRQLGSFADSALFCERERAALAYAEAITRSRRRAEDPVMERLRAEFDDDAIIELTALITFQNMSNLFNTALGVSTQEFCAPADRVASRSDAGSAEVDS